MVEDPFLLLAPNPPREPKLVGEVYGLIIVPTYKDWLTALQPNSKWSLSFSKICLHDKNVLDQYPLTIKITAES